MLGDVVQVVGGGENFGLIDVVDTNGFENLYDRKLSVRVFVFFFFGGMAKEGWSGMERANVFLPDTQQSVQYEP